MLSSRSAILSCEKSFVKTGGKRQALAVRPEVQKLRRVPRLLLVAWPEAHVMRGFNVRSLHFHLHVYSSHPRQQKFSSKTSTRLGNRTQERKRRKLAICQSQPSNVEHKSAIPADRQLNQLRTQLKVSVYSLGLFFWQNIIRQCHVQEEKELRVLLPLEMNAFLPQPYMRFHKHFYHILSGAV